MRWFFFLLAAVSAVFLIYSIVHLTHRLQKPPVHVVTEEKLKRLWSLSPSGSIPTSRAFDFIQGSPAEAQQNNQNKTWYFWLSFLATAFTAGAALVSGIQAGINNPAKAKFSAVLVAILTFLGAMTNTAASHFNDNATAGSTSAIQAIQHRQPALV
jgi:hypothetical protein